MSYIRKQPHFEFHPRWKTLGLNHLCFVDDLVLFCKGDYRSVQMILQGLNLFTAITCLKASPAKSNVYGCGMSDQEM